MLEIIYLIQCDNLKIENQILIIYKYIWMLLSNSKTTSINLNLWKIKYLNLPDIPIQHKKRQINFVKDDSTGPEVVLILSLKHILGKDTGLLYTMVFEIPCARKDKFYWWCSGWMLRMANMYIKIRNQSQNESGIFTNTWH